jgi:hypothetical protein
MFARHHAQWAVAATNCPTGMTKAQNVPTATPRATVSRCMRHSCGWSILLATGLSQAFSDSVSRVGIDARMFSNQFERNCVIEKSARPILTSCHDPA